MAGVFFLIRLKNIIICNKVAIAIFALNFQNAKEL